MGRVSHTQTGLFGGVSQQTPGLRLGNQVAEMVNMFPSIAKGPTRRSPTVDIGDLSTFAPDWGWSTDEGNFKTRLHKIDGAESYLVFLTQVSGDPIRVFDLDAAELPVIFQGSTQSYCEANTTSASGGNLKAVTILDTTYLVNTTVTPAMTSALSKWGLDLTGNKYEWIASGSGTNEYYCRLAVGRDVDADGDGVPDGTVTYDPNISRPEEVLENDIQISEGTLGSLAVGEWGYGDNDSLGYDTVYIRLTDEVDPDTKADGYVFAKPTDKVAFLIFSDGTKKVAISIEIDGEQYGRTASSTNAVNFASSAYTVVNTDIAGGAQATYVGTGDIGSTLRVTKETGGANVDFQIAINDLPNARLVKEKVDKFTDLPRVANDGDILEVTGEAAESSGSPYWVRYDASTGRWVETLPDGLSYQIDNTTMPVQMVRKQDDGVGTVTGTPNQLYFEVSEITWGDRLVGDNDTNPLPSFIGEPIQDIFFYQNRLGLASGESVILSQSAEYFNFWGQTTTEVIDDDPIDLTVAQNSAVRIQWVFPFSQSLEIIGDRKQFSMHSGKDNPTLTPKQAVVDPTTSLEISSAVRPVRLDNKLFMLVEFLGDHAEVWRYTVEGGLAGAVEITKAIPNYIPVSCQSNTPTIHHMEGCAEKGMLFVHPRCAAPDNPSDGSARFLFDTYVYNYFEQGGELAQSAWHKWTCRSAWSACFGSIFYSVASRSLVGLGGSSDYRYRLESMALEPAPAYPDYYGGLYLDGISRPASVSIDGNGNLNTTLDYPVVNDLLDDIAIVCVDEGDLTDASQVYLKNPLAGAPDLVSTEIIFEGTLGGTVVNDHYIGFIYDSYVEPTEPTLLREGQGTQIGRLVQLSETVRVEDGDEVRIGIRSRRRRSMFNEDVRTYEDYTGVLLAQGQVDTYALAGSGTPPGTPFYELSEFSEGTLRVAFRVTSIGHPTSQALIGNSGGGEVTITLDSTVAATDIEDTVDVTITNGTWSATTAVADRPHVHLADGRLHILEAVHDGTSLTSLKLDGIPLTLTGTVTGDWFQNSYLRVFNNGTYEIESITLTNGTTGAQLRASFNQEDADESSTLLYYTDASGLETTFECFLTSITPVQGSDTAARFEKVEAFRWREFTTRDGQTAIPDKYYGDFMFRAGVHLRAEDTVVRIASHDIWPLTISSATWVANYLGNARGV